MHRRCLQCPLAAKVDQVIAMRSYGDKLDIRVILCTAVLVVRPIEKQESDPPIPVSKFYSSRTRVVTVCVCQVYIQSTTNLSRQVTCKVANEFVDCLPHPFSRYI